MLRNITVALIAQIALTLAAQEDPKQAEFRGQDAQRVAAWLKVSQDHAADYRLVAKDAPDSPLKLLPKAVFRHSQPVRGDDIGAVYLWVDDTSLPGALGTVFAYSYGRSGVRLVAHEFHSLSDRPLVAKWRDSAVWAPSEPGLAWKEVAESQAAAENSNARLRQMREIGRRFAAHSTDSRKSRWELRLITQPIYQYTVEKASERIGGAVFLFCQGTDPEIILLLEARRVNGRSTWHYALAPFTDYGVSVSLDDREVWSLPTNRRPTRNSTHWWNGGMEVKLLSADEEMELAKKFNAVKTAE